MARFILNKTDFTLSVREFWAASDDNRIEFFPYANDIVNHSAPQRLVRRGNEIRISQMPSEYLVTAPDKVDGVLEVIRGDQVAAWDVQAGRGVLTPVAGEPVSEPRSSGEALHTGHTFSAAAYGAASHTLFVMTLSALLGGLVLNLMPCVFPVLGIKILGFVHEEASNRRRVRLHGLTFALGVLLSFWALAGFLTVLRASGKHLGWGFQLQSAGFVYCLVVVMLIFGFSLSGVFEFGWQLAGLGTSVKRKGYSGSFCSGVLAAVVATPCSAPFLAPALGAALVLPSTQSFLVVSTIAAGFSMPYLLLSIFPEAIKVLPKPGRWTETFKQAMAFPLYASAGYLIWVLTGQTTGSSLLTALLSLVVIAMACWIYGRYAKADASKRHALVGVIGSLSLFALGLHMGWPRLAATDDIVWEPWSAERVGQLRASDQAVFVDFTARWCATCQVNKTVVFGSDDVKRYFKSKNIATLEADWTNQNPQITAELAKWGRAAVPFNLVYLPGQAEPSVLPEVLTPGTVLKAVTDAYAQ
jgi:thiol:disulfide interchange protein